MNKVAAMVALTVASAMCPAQLQGNLYLVQSHDQTGYINQEFPDQISASTIIGNVVTFTQSVALENIQQRGFDFGGWFAFLGVPQAHLTISRFSTSPSPQHLPGASSVGSEIVFDGVRSSVVNNVTGHFYNFEVDATGIFLDPGTYLVTSVPVASISTHGQGMTQAAEGPSINDSWVRGGLTNGQWVKLAESGLGTGQDREVGMGINGRAVPEPAILGTLMFGILAMRRRRVA